MILSNRRGKCISIATPNSIIRSLFNVSPLYSSNRLKGAFELNVIREPGTDNLINFPM